LGNYYITIYPTGGNRVVSCADDIATILFGGADRVIINGSIDAVGDNRNLTIENNFNTGAWSVGIGFARESNNGSNNIEVRNTIIRAASSTPIYSYPLYIGASTIDAGEDNHDMLFENNAFERGRIGAYVYRFLPDAYTAYNIQFIINDFGSFVESDRLTYRHLSYRLQI
jgi:hypothetical protein